VPNASTHVFISYASQDAAVAGALVEALERHGVKCWIAPRDVKAGALYADAIARAISGAKAFVLVLSESAIASSHVSKEIERASSKKRPIVALRIDAAPLTPALEYFLSESQWVEAQTGSMEAAYAKLIEDIPDPARTAPRNTPAVALEVSAATARVAHPKLRFNWILLAAGTVLVVVGLLAYKFWISSRVAQEKPVAMSSLAPAVVVPRQPTISENSVAVLPFVDMSEKKDQEYFSDGLSEELIDMLTKIPDLRVPARTSSFSFKGKQATIADIAKALSVAHVLEGSVRKAGNHLRITAQLVRADNGYHLWSATYDRQLDDIFKVQDEIAGAVVKALKVSLMGGSLPETTGAQNIEAFNLFLQARSMWRQANEPAAFKRVVEYLRRVVDADPQFADAWALLSRALLAEAIPLDAPPDNQLMEEARRAAHQALKVNSALPGPHLAYASIVLCSDLDVRGARAQIQQALDLDPNSTDALHWAAWLSMVRGQFEKALELAQKSTAIDPVNPTAYRDLAWIYYFAGKDTEALLASRKMLDLDPGKHRVHHRLAAFLLVGRGDPAGALGEIEGEKEERQNCSCLVLAYDALARKREADAALANLEQHHAAENAFDIGIVYATRGELDQAFQWLDRAYRQRDIGLLSLKVGRYVKNLRSDPRYNPFLRKLGLLD
jgi:TolB-like protein/Flp pilus assembly protein TadD